MKVRIKIIEDDSISDDVIEIRCHHITPEIEKLAANADVLNIKGIYRGTEIMIPLEDVLFFETEGDGVFAHLAKQAYSTRYRLYNLEETLPAWFMRISKSTIVNIRAIASLERNLTSSRAITYNNTHKVSYVSRMYYPGLKQKLEERSLL